MNYYYLQILTKFILIIKNNILIYLMDKLLTSETAGKVMTKDSACPSLSFKDRVIGFIVCLGLGLVFSFVSIAGIFFMLGNPIKFGVFFSLGNICSIGSTLFFVGPARQCKLMFKNIRLIATLLFIGSIIGTIVFVFFYDSKNHFWHKFVMLGLIVAQFAAMVWYVLSYIPFGRAAMKKICCVICCSDDDDDQQATKS